jgi:ADP-ribose pyrophosphatase YjhB (NUDIX family)
MSRLYPVLPIPGVAGLTLRGRKVLLVERGKAPHDGLWGLPGGVVEVGETLEEAVTREVLEETSVVVRPTEFLQVFNSINREEDKVRTHYILFEFLCEYVSGEVEPGDDAPDARWVSIDDLDSVNIMGFTKEFIIRVLTERGIL